MKANIAIAVTVWTCASAAAPACVSGGDGEHGAEMAEARLGADGEAGARRRETDHGPIGFGASAAAAAALTAEARYHAWTFELSGAAEVTLATGPAVSGQRRTDTVLYLYREGPAGWGAHVARNDDAGGSPYSRIERALGAGRYRALVAGRRPTTRGRFALAATCAGAGCAPPDRDACLFGETYGALARRPALRVDGTDVVTAETLAWLAPEDGARLVRAVQQSVHWDVTTPMEAIERVDGREVRVTRVAEPAARRRFTAFEYGVGGRSYGAIFEPVSEGEAMVSRIEDGDLVECTVRRETCLLPEDYAALRASPAFERTSQRTVTAASQLAGIEVEQALAALRRVYGPDTTIESGLAQADGGALNVGAYRHRATGRAIVVFELGAGDTSMGSIYYRGETRIAGVIRDLFIEGCTLFE